MPVREAKRVRFTDLLTIRRIRTEAEWDQMRGDLDKKLDQRVRELLRDFDVELE